jgi:hypothetical protein
MLSTIGLPCKWNWLHQKLNQQCLLGWKKPEKVLEYDIQTAAYILEWYVKSPCLWALVWHSNPCLVPDLNVLCVQFSYWPLILSPVAKLGASSPSLGYFTDCGEIGRTGRANWFCLLRASPMVLSICDPAKIFFTSKFSYSLFLTGTTKRWGTTISQPLGRISMMGESETLSNSQIIFITLFYAGAQLCWHLCLLLGTQNFAILYTSGCPWPSATLVHVLENF